MIERESQIKELYDLKHRKDNEIHTHFDYENELLNKMMPDYARRNDTVNQFCLQIQRLFVWGIETQLPLRNFYNYTVDKYYNKHPN
jgi:hypothetical protein